MRRLSARALGVLAIALVAITCTDSPTNPGRGAPARLDLAPAFSPTASRAYSALQSMGVSVSRVHIVLVAADGRTAKDTTIDFPAGQDTLVVELPLQIQGSEQAFRATLDLQDAQGQVLFSSVQQVVARSVTLPAAPTTVITLQYVGPGHAARTVTVSPADITLAAGGTQALTATAVDSSGRTLADVLVEWTSSDTLLASVTRTANATATLRATGRRGIVTITAATPTGIAGTARFTLPPLAGRVVIVSGGGQTATAGHTLAQPIVVRVDGVDSLPIAGAHVSVRAMSAGATVTDTGLTTDASGRASTTMTLGRQPGTYLFELASGTAREEVSATATPTTASALAIFSGNAQVDSVGRTLPLPFVVRATDEFNAPVAGATVTFARVAGSGALSAATVTTDSGGYARTSYTLGATAGTDSVRATLQNVSTAAGTVLFTARAIPRGAAQLAIAAGNGQTAAAGATLPTNPAVRVTDANGNPVAGTRVVFLPKNGSRARGLAAPDSVATDAAGLASTVWTMGTAAGTDSLVATSGALAGSPAIFVATVTAAAASRYQVGALPASPTPGQTVTVKAILQDSFGNRVRTAGQVVTWSVSPAAGSFSSATSATDTSGLAQVTYTPSPVAGTAVTITATSGSITGSYGPVTTATGAATALTFAGGWTVSGTTPSGAAFAPQPVLQLVDAGGNPVKTSGVAVVAHIASGPTSPAPVLADTVATTDTLGRAAFGALGISGAAGTYSVSFSSGGLTPVTSGPLAVGAGTATRIALITPPSSSATNGVALAQQPVVQLVDSSGNAVAQAGLVVVASTSPGGTQLSGDTVVTDGAGRAAYTALAIRGPAGNYVLRFGSGALTAAVSGTVVLQAGAPTQLTVVSGAGSGPAGEVRSVSVRASDASGNGVNGRTITWSVQSGGGSVTTTSQTDASGVAQATWTTGMTIGVQTLRASDLSSTLSRDIVDTTVAPTGARLVIVTQPGGAVSGDTLAPQPVVRLRDSSGTRDLAGAGIAVTAAADSAAGLAGPLTATTDSSGIARFAGLRVTGTVGNHRLVFSASGFAPSDSSAPFAVTAGAPAAIDSTFGGGQSAGAGGVLPQPIGVRVKDARGLAVSGASVTFHAHNGGKVIAGGVTDSVRVVATDSLGIARASWKLGPQVGTDSVQISVAGVTPVILTATATSLPATHFVIVSGNAQSDTVTNYVDSAVVVEARDSLEHPVAGVAVVIDLGASGTNGSIGFHVITEGDFYPTDSARTDSLGRYAFAWRLSNRAKVDSALVSNGAFAPVLVTATALQGAPVALAFAEPASGLNDAVGATLRPFHVFVTDIGGVDTIATVNSPITVQLYRNCGEPCNEAAYLTGRSVVTPVNGVAAFDSLQITMAGTGYYFTAQNGDGLVGGPTAYFDITPAGTQFHEVGSHPASAVAGSTVQVLIRSQNARGEAIPNAPIIVQSTYGTLALTNGTAPGTTRDSSRTDASGLITLSWTLPSEPMESVQVDVFNYDVPEGAALHLFITAAPPPTTRTLAIVNGARLIVPVGASGIPQDSVVFLVRDSVGNPVAGHTIDVYAEQPQVCSVDTRSVTTSATGRASSSLTLNGQAGGCVVRATLDGQVTRDAMIAVVPSGTTAVWYGDTTSAADYNTPSNWRTTAGAAVVPGASDNVYLPLWGNYTYIPGFVASIPVAHQNSAVNGMAIAQYAYLDLNGFALATTSHIRLEYASGIYYGRVTAGGAGVEIGGPSSSASIDTLVIGRAGSCAADSAVVAGVYTYATQVVCTANITGTVGSSRFVAGAGSRVVLSTPFSYLYGDSVIVTGTSMSARGYLYANVYAQLTPAAMTVDSTASVQSGGDLALGQPGGSLTVGPDAYVYAQGNAVFGGGGTSRGTIQVNGDATFTGNAFTLPAGELALYGNFTQLSTYSPSAFAASGTHLTELAGSADQTMTFASPSSSNLHKLGNYNFTGTVTLGSGTRVTGSSTLASGTRLSLTNATFADTLRTYNAVLSLLGANSFAAAPSGLFLQTSSTLNIPAGASLTGGCQRPDSQPDNVQIIGSGTINGQPANSNSCLVIASPAVAVRP